MRKLLLLTLILTGCGTLAEPTTPITKPTPKVVSPSGENLQGLAQTLAGMLSYGNSTGAQMKLNAARDLTDCLLEAYPAYFPADYDEAKQQALADRFLKGWAQAHPRGESAVATAPMQIDIPTNTATGPRSAATVGVIVVRDCETKA